ncbi:hypothetical protein A8C32_14995 [Flavivirga aquatica]|uniref:Membrane bound FAD containing D-sorbitol dehydrogenase n=1 Tax=Flavivirga aquatica TaxID=1849968 RepID=A0A1E5T8T6_9FLAO|nr:hypothetical protein [Flavivirga aquatica]OEK07793.1 hypothetical protein A8C32_14995 [Flavivirga aquatica]
METYQENLNVFLDLSVVLTDFSSYELQGTGQLEAYYSTIIDVIGESNMVEVLDAFTLAKTNANGNETELEKQIRIQLLSNDKLGPITRNIIKMWFIGNWYQLPNIWRETYGAYEKDETFVVSAIAYTEGLLWPTIGSHPPGAKAPGYATWIDAPQISKV